MIVSMIAAMGHNRVIGKDNQMMWHLPMEFKYFKEKTLGHCIITGRKNFMAQGRALPGRTNIIVTRDTALKIEGCVVLNSIEQALAYAKDHGEEEAFIIGGGQIYKQSLDLVDKIYLTEVDYDGAGDVYFPEFEELLFEKELSAQLEVNEKNSLAWKAYIFTRI